MESDLFMYACRSCVLIAAFATLALAAAALTTATITSTTATSTACYLIEGVANLIVCGFTTLLDITHEVQALTSQGMIEIDGD